jgi:hypothetical protein
MNIENLPANTQVFFSLSEVPSNFVIVREEQFIEDDISLIAIFAAPQN